MNTPEARAASYEVSSAPPHLEPLAPQILAVDTFASTEATDFGGEDPLGTGAFLADIGLGVLAVALVVKGYQGMRDWFRAPHNNGEEAQQRMLSYEIKKRRL